MNYSVLSQYNDSSSERISRDEKWQRDQNALRLLSQRVSDGTTWTNTRLLQLCKDIRHVARLQEPSLSAFPKYYKDYTGLDLPYISQSHRVNYSRDGGLNKKTGGLQGLLKAVPGLVLAPGYVSVQTSYSAISSSDYEDDSDDDDLCETGDQPPFSLSSMRSIEKFPRLPGNCLLDSNFYTAICLKCSEFAVDPVLSDCGHMYCYHCISVPGKYVEPDSTDNNIISWPNTFCLGCDSEILRYRRLAAGESSDDDEDDDEEDPSSAAFQLLKLMYTKIKIHCNLMDCCWHGSYWAFTIRHHAICYASTIRGINMSDDETDEIDETERKSDYSFVEGEDDEDDEKNHLHPYPVKDTLLEEFRTLIEAVKPIGIKKVPLRVLCVREAIRDDNLQVAEVKAGEKFELLAHPENSLFGLVAVRRFGTLEQFWASTAVFKRRDESRTGYFQFLADLKWQVPELENQ